MELRTAKHAFTGCSENNILFRDFNARIVNFLLYLVKNNEQIHSYICSKCIINNII
ncbi:hypothetical protein ABID22_003185 [Pontibacter aydingkolensis]